MVKKILKLILPKRIFRKIELTWSFYKLKKEFKEAYFYDLERYIQYSESRESKSGENLIGLIVRRYHVVEKGLTMPNTRLGFGKQVMVELIKDCLKYIQQFGKDDDQLLQALAVIVEYKEFHEVHNYSLDDDLLLAIGEIYRVKADFVDVITVHQKEFTRGEYFSNSDSRFPEFSKSRSSIRNFSEEEVSLETIRKALSLAKTAPSACNRQSWRTYVFTDAEQIKQILETQGGNRGFGHLTNKLIVISSEIGVFSGVSERNQVFIDGGIYAMNLLYGLHYNQIAACILNCSNTIEKDKKLRHLCNIKDSEVFIALIACGIPPATFKAAASIRYKLDKTNTIL